MSLSYRDVSHKAVAGFCMITSCRAKFNEMTEATRKSSVLTQPSPESFIDKNLFPSPTGGSTKLI